MSVCKGCYRPVIEDYCPPCRKALFDGVKVSAMLQFDAPKDETLPLYQEKTKRLSISGVQLKYSLRLEEKKLVLTDSAGHYILKPIPPAVTIQKRDQAPENEHLTMQLASKIYKIPTAANAVIYFKDKSPAYLTRRFDIRPDGKKYLQEDMAQISGKTRQTLGENFKYEGTYEEIGRLIQKHVAAAPPALENFFRLVLFNYLFSNGDAHLKNFSLYQTEMGDYNFTPAYDLMSTILHMPNESDTALDLYTGVHQSKFYNRYGFYGQADFRKLAEIIGILPLRVERILTQMLSSKDEVLDVTRKSFLSEDSKLIYANAYLDKLKRMGITRTMIARIVDKEHPGIYTAAEVPVTLLFQDRTEVNGFFAPKKDSAHLENENKYSFVKAIDAINYQETKDEKYISIIEGDLILEVKMNK
jgi:serine/threonine-protein kinase HipA